MRLKLVAALAAIAIPVISFASSITFDNRTSQSVSAIRLYIGSAGAGACSSTPLLQKITGNKGYTNPKEVNVAAFTSQMEAVLCKNKTCKADLFMNQDCSGSPLAQVILPLGQASQITPENAGKYHFTPMVDGVIMTCADGTDNC